MARKSGGQTLSAGPPPGPVSSKTVTIHDPESDLFSDAMDRASGTFHGVMYGVRKNAEKAGESMHGEMDGERLVRRALAAAIRDYVEELPAVATGDESQIVGWTDTQTGATGELCTLCGTEFPIAQEAAQGETTEVEKLGQWLMHEDECAAINGKAAFVDPCTCGLDKAIEALGIDPETLHPKTSGDPA